MTSVIGMKATITRSPQIVTLEIIKLKSTGAGRYQLLSLLVGCVIASSLA